MNKVENPFEKIPDNVFMFKTSKLKKGKTIKDVIKYLKSKGYDCVKKKNDANYIIDLNPNKVKNE